LYRIITIIIIIIIIIIIYFRGLTASKLCYQVVDIINIVVLYSEYEPTTFTMLFCLFICLREKLPNCGDAVLQSYLLLGTIIHTNIRRTNFALGLQITTAHTFLLNSGLFNFCFYAYLQALILDLLSVDRNSYLLSVRSEQHTTIGIWTDSHFHIHVIFRDMCCLLYLPYTEFIYTISLWFQHSCLPSMVE